MSSIITLGFYKTLCRGTKSYVPVLSSFRCISNKRKADVSRPPPYPYKTRNFTIPFNWFEDTEDRFNENTKIICVEGPPAAGKTKFCQELAEELDMLALPPANMDMLYKYGDFDFRSLDDNWSTENMKSFDEKTFCKNPNHCNSAIFQFRMLQLRFSQYVDAVAHMLSTGQGVVMQRSPFSDYIFIEAMEKSGYVTKRVKDIYYEVCKFTFTELYKPHLIIYLDVPVDKVRENVNKRGHAWERNSPVYSNDTYLNKIEQIYKNEYLSNMSDKCELLVYDWADGGETEVVVEDIERIDFDNYDHFSNKLREWRELTTKEWNELRLKYADDKRGLMMAFNNVERFDAPELVYTGDENLEFIQAIKNTPELKFQPGFNPEKDNVMFKLNTSKETRFYLF